MIDTVDGRNPAIHLRCTCIKPVVNDGMFTIPIGAGFFRSTVRLGTLQPSRCLADEHDMLTMLAGALPDVCLHKLTASPCKQSLKVDGALGYKIVPFGESYGCDKGKNPIPSMGLVYLPTFG